MIEMREGLKDDRYNVRMPRPSPSCRAPCASGYGNECGSTALWRPPSIVRSLSRRHRLPRKAGVEAVAVCYLHAYRDPKHEKATGRALARRLPEAYMSLSSEVLPQIKEYERVCTTVVNAYVGPGLSRYLHQLARTLSPPVTRVRS